MLQVPSVDKWSNMSLLFQPTGYLTDNEGFSHIYRIYTTLENVGQIQVDNNNISALLYRRIGQSNFYYYENQTTTYTHRISALDSSAIYSVSLTHHCSKLTKKT